MTFGHFSMWSFTMNCVIFLLVLRAFSQVHTNEIQNADVQNEKLIGAIFSTRTIEEITSSSFSKYETVSNTINVELLNKAAFRVPNYQSKNRRNDITEIYDRIDVAKNFSEFSGNTLHNEETLTTFMDVSISQSSNNENTPIKLSSTNITINNESHLNNYDMKNNATYLIKSVVYSFVNKMWTLFSIPFFQILTSKIRWNGTNKIKNFTDPNLITKNSAVLKILFDKDEKGITKSTPILNNSRELSNKTPHWRSSLLLLPTTQSLSFKQQNESKTAEDTAIIIDPITRIFNKTESQSSNDSSIRKNDTNVPFSIQSPTYEEIQESNYRENMRNEIMNSLFDVKNNSVNDNSMSMFIEIMMQNYNNSKNRMPFSSRYSRINNITYDKQNKRKREIPYTSEYNSIDRQELASYYYNDKKIRENFLNYAKISDQDSVASDIYNTDKIYDRAEFRPYPIQTIYVRNHDALPTMDSLDETEKANFDIAQNYHPNINTSSLLYLIDKFGYSISHDTETKITSTQMSVEYEPTYSRNKLPVSRITASKLKQISTRKNASMNKMTHRRRSHSMKKNKSKPRGVKKSRRNQLKMPMKSVKRTNAKKNNFNSLKYLRTRSKYKRKNNRRNLLKKKRIVSMRRMSSRQKSKRNHKRTRQSTNSRANKYR